MRRWAKHCSMRIVGTRQGTAFTTHNYEEVWSLIDHQDRKVQLAIAPMLEWLGRLDPADAVPRGDYPFVLAAGQRRMFNANQIFRDPAWRRDDPDGALLISTCRPGIARRGRRRLDRGAVRRAAASSRAASATTACGSGQLALPHGYGQDYPAADGERLTNGPRVNVLTDSGNRDPDRRHALSQARPGAAGAADGGGSRDL